MADSKPKKNNRQQQATLRIVALVAIIACVNVLASYFHRGLDLTQEERFNLSVPTKDLLRNMKETAVIEVYLQGKFPADLQRLQEGVRERLKSFKDLAGNKIIYRFTEPFAGKDEQQQKQVAHDLALKGIRVMQLNMQDEDQYSSKFFFPYALIQYNGHETPISLLEDPPNKSASEKISYAIGKLEYKLAHAINEMSKPDVAHIAYVTGNNEDLGMNTLDMLSSLSRIYRLDTLDLQHVLNIPRVYDAIIINKPTEPFTGPEKLKIDQYIMHGGHVLWVLNTTNAVEDSLLTGQLMAMPYDLQLDDILFKYGVRVNTDLVQDKQCLELPHTYNNGAVKKDPWVYYPRINPTSPHPIVRNMDFVMGRFTNSIDTIISSAIKKTVLLQSSKYSRTANAPARVTISMMNYPIKNELFTNPYRTVAMLLEGKFTSAYKHKLAPEFVRLMDSLKTPFKAECDRPGKMIVISLGDAFSNGYTVKEGVLPVGYFKWTGEYFANKTLLLNSLEYLTDTSGILEARSKEMKVRLLDQGRIRDEKSMWTAVNVGVPIAAVLVFASAYLFFRKRRYESRSQGTKNTITTNA